MSQVVFIIQHPGHDPREREDEDEKKKQEQEAKLKKLLKENEMLQKDIAEVKLSIQKGQFLTCFLNYLQKDRKIDILKKHVAAKREAAAAAARAKEEEESRRLEAATGASNGNLRSEMRLP